MKARNWTVTQLLNLSDVRDVSVNAVVLKASVDILVWLKNTAWVTIFLRKLISMWKNRVSMNIGCNDNLFTCLVGEHSHLVPFWCIVHQLELAMEGSIAKGLLNDIKECLKKLYHLYNKSTKKLRSLREPINELGDFVDLTDNFIKSDGVAPLRSFGTRWIAHLIVCIGVSLLPSPPVNLQTVQASPLFRQSPLIYWFFIFSWTPKILKFFLLHPILCFKSN